jgi:lipid-binding SYLF domain-containing protein
MKYMKRHSKLLTTITLHVMTIATILSVQVANAASATEINIKANSALRAFKQEVAGGSQFLDKAKAVLIFPDVIKAGFGIGGEYGEGVLRAAGKTVAYYNTASASLGFQVGGQIKSVVIVFLEQQALANFRRSDGWKVGVDGSVAVIEWGLGEDINTLDIGDPVVGFVFNNKGLMYNLTIEGSKITQIHK